jgi:hypothetical protein
MPQKHNMKYHTHRHLGITPFECPYHVIQPSPNDLGATVKTRCPVAEPEPAALLRHKKKDHGYVPKIRAQRGSVKAARQVAKLNKQRSRLAVIPRLIPERIPHAPVKQEEEAEPELTVSLSPPSGQPTTLPQQALCFESASSISLASTQWSTALDSSSPPAPSTSLTSTQSLTSLDCWSTQHPPTTDCTQYAGQTQYVAYPSTWNEVPTQAYAGPTLNTGTLGGVSMLPSQLTTQYTAAPSLTGSFSGGMYASPSEVFALVSQFCMNNGLLLVPSQASSSVSSSSSFAPSLGPSPPLADLVSSETNFMPMLHQKTQ